jgi:hypothetical protein
MAVASVCGWRILGVAPSKCHLLGPGRALMVDKLTRVPTRYSATTLASFEKRMDQESLGQV